MKNLVVLITVLFFTFIGRAQTDVYGVTSSGGAYHAGTIFKTDISGNNYTKVKDLVAYPQNQSLEICKASNGNYYGFGSMNNRLNIYQYDTLTLETKIVSTLKSLADTVNFEFGAGFAAAPNGKLYGMVRYSGLIGSNNWNLSLIEFDPVTYTVVIKSTLTNSSYYLNHGQFLLASNGNFYVALGNKIYEYNYTANTFVVKATGTDVIHHELTEYNGNLYGIYGNTYNSGPWYSSGICKYNLTTSAYTESNLSTLGFPHQVINVSTGLELAANGHMYFFGQDYDNVLYTRYPTIFNFDPVANTLTSSYQSSNQNLFLFLHLTKASNNKLYAMGTTSVLCTPQPNYICGDYVMYEFDPATNNLTQKSSLTPYIDNNYVDLGYGFYYNGFYEARLPHSKFSVHNSSKIIASVGNSILEYNVITDNFTKKSQMSRNFGASPNGKPLIKNNILYSDLGNASFNSPPYGPLLKYDISSGTISPTSSTITSIGGNLIDVSATDIFIGDGPNNGYAYNYNVTSNSVTPMYYTDSESSGYFSKASDGLIYGTGIEFITGNDYSCVYAVDIANNVEYIVNMFSNILQGADMRGIIQASNGKMYGVTNSGGVFSKGVLYSMDITGFNVTKLIDFNGTLRGAFPDGQLVQGTNGKIYGTARRGGVNNKGVLFSYDINTSTFAKVLDFDGVAKGEQPNGFLQLLPNNLIMGMTNKGGVNNRGVIFTYNYVTNTFTKKLDFDGVNNGANPEKCGFTYDCLAASMPSAGLDKVICNNGQTILGDPSNSNLYTYIWTPTVGINMPSSPNPTLTVSTNTATIIMNASCDQTNVIDTVMVTSIAPQTPSICEVTVDSLSQYNHIIWNKTAYTNVDSFIVYREVVTGYYLRIGGQPYNALSDFQDTSRLIGPANGNPNIGTYRYKLQIKDSCGNVSALSPYHNSIYFNNNNGTFTWNTYDVQGTVTPVSQFNLIRDDVNNGNWQVVGSVTGSQNILNDPAYTTYSATANWRVEALGFSCNPTAKTTQQINKTKSNVKNNFTVGLPTSVGNTELSTSVLIVPNPATTELVVSFKTVITTVTKIVVTDVLGKVVYTSNTQEGNSIVIPVNELHKGVYFMKIEQGKNYTVKKFIKE